MFPWSGLWSKGTRRPAWKGERTGEGMVILPEVYVYENKSWLPRAFLVGDSVSCSSEEECLDVLGTVDVRKTLVTREGGDSHGEPKGTVEFLERTPNRIVIEAETDRPADLFISEMWYPGWVAFDNGRRVAVNRADYLFRSLPLKEGRHRIEMLYRPASFLAGKWVSAMTLSLSLGYLFFTRKKWWAQ